MRVQTEEWRRFIPGVRMYKGKKTLFYNGEKLGNMVTGKYLIYDLKERQSWEVIIVLPGVKTISTATFETCKNVKKVIMADTVKRIKERGFFGCDSLVFVKLSINLEFIGRMAFFLCKPLTSIFIPPSCAQICINAFANCKKLVILSVPQHTELGHCIIGDTALYFKSPIYAFENHIENEQDINAEVNAWLKNINNDEQYALHLACSSFNPMEEVIYGIIQREKSLSVFERRNSIGITPLQYLEANPFASIDQKKIMKRFVLDMIGENVL